MASLRQTAPAVRRAAIYTRVSTGLQEQEGTSLETQEQRCRSYAEEKGYSVDEGLVLREVHSGTELWERRQLQGLRDAVRRRDIDVVVVYSIDRLARDPVHLGVIISEAEHAGVEVEFVSEPLDNSPEGQLIRFVRGYAAKVEHEKIRERTIRGRRARADAGKMLPASRPLYGYRWRDAERTALDVDEETALTVRRIFREMADGGTLRGVAARLTDEGIPTPARSSRGWYFSTVYRILKNRHYTGDAAAWKPENSGRSGGPKPPSSGPTIPLSDGTIPPLVDVDTFDAIQARLEANKAQAARNNHNPEAALLRGGYARCGYCGSALQTHPEARTRAPVYGCPHNSRGNGWESCPKYGIMAKILDDAVWQRVEQILQQPDVIAQELQRQHREDPTANDLAALDRALKETRNKQRNLVANLALVQGSAAALVASQLDELGRQEQRLESERETVLHRADAWIQAEQRLSDLEQWCRQVAGRLGQLSYENKRTALEALGVQVRVWRSDHDPRYEITMSIPLDGPNGSDCVTRDKKRASLHAVRGAERLAAFERDGLEVLNSSLEEFRRVLRSESHTLKRALTDPDLFSGIGNAYSDEVLHRARLSPVKLTGRLSVLISSEN